MRFVCSLMRTNGQLAPSCQRLRRLASRGLCVLPRVIDTQRVLPPTRNPRRGRNACCEEDVSSRRLRLHRDWSATSRLQYVFRHVIQRVLPSACELVLKNRTPAGHNEPVCGAMWSTDRRHPLQRPSSRVSLRAAEVSVFETRWPYSRLPAAVEHPLRALMASGKHTLLAPLNRIALGHVLDRAGGSQCGCSCELWQITKAWPCSRGRKLLVGLLQACLHV